MLKDLSKLIDESLTNFENYSGLETIRENLKILSQASRRLNSINIKVSLFYADYDFDEKNTGNGFRSFVHISDKAAENLSALVVKIEKCQRKLMLRRNIFER